MKEEIFDVVVVGANAAGMMAAIKVSLNFCIIFI
jgi:predicted flavoprotein YhiN